MSDFLAMGGYAFFVWTSYGIFLTTLVLGLVLPALRRRALIKELRQAYRRAEARRKPPRNQGAEQ
ncbi:MAG: heme exporter protein D [Lysobacteraceae bacterium]|nr:MAG: heme exporter protein D [Xanthomonadaceae bacterium]